MAVTPKFRMALPNFNDVGWDDDVNGNFSLIDGLLSQYVGIFGVVGIWTTSTAYAVGDKVVDSADSSFWSCLVLHTSAASGNMAADRAAHPTYWESATASNIEAEASADAAADSAAQAVGAAQSVAGLGAYRNAIVNGGMTVWQRGSPIGPLPGIPYYMADKWWTQFDGTGGTTTVTRNLRSTTSALLSDAGIKDFIAYNIIALPTSPTIRQFAHDIENVMTFAGRTVTLSYYARGVGGNVAVGMQAVQMFGTGGSPSSTVVNFIANATWTTTWQRFSHTFVLPTVTGKVLGTNDNDKLQLMFTVPSNQVVRFDFTGACLELGSTANAFPYRPADQEVSMCQRFLQQVDFLAHNYGIATSSFAINYMLPVQMRAPPTLQLITSADAFLTGITTNAGVRAINRVGTISTTGTAVHSASYYLGADLT